MGAYPKKNGYLGIGFGCIPKKIGFWVLGMGMGKYTQPKPIPNKKRGGNAWRVVVLVGVVKGWDLDKCLSWTLTDKFLTKKYI